MKLDYINPWERTGESKARYLSRIFKPMAASSLLKIALRVSRASKAAQPSAMETAAALKSLQIAVSNIKLPINNRRRKNNEQ